MSGTYYGVELSDDYELEMDQIHTFTEEGTACIIVDEITDLESLGIDFNKVEMVERDF